MLDDLLWFVRVVDAGNIARAAANANIHPQTLSRKIQQLEVECDVKLFLHKGNALELTNDGRIVYNQVRQSIIELTYELDHANNIIHGVSGTAILVLPPWLMPLFFQKLAPFQKKYPNLELKILSGFYNYINGAPVEYDIALALTNPTHDYVITKKVIQLNVSVYATEKYIQHYGSINHPMELVNHKLILPCNLGIDQTTATFFTDNEEEQIKVNLDFCKLKMDNSSYIAYTSSVSNEYVFFTSAEIAAKLSDSFGLKLVRQLENFYTSNVFDILILKRAKSETLKMKILQYFIYDCLLGISDLNKQ